MDFIDANRIGPEGAKKIAVALEKNSSLSVLDFGIIVFILNSFKGITLSELKEELQ